MPALLDLGWRPIIFEVCSAQVALVARCLGRARGLPGGEMGVLLAATMAQPGCCAHEVARAVSAAAAGHSFPAVGDATAWRNTARQARGSLFGAADAFLAAAAALDPSLFCYQRSAKQEGGGAGVDIAYRLHAKHKGQVRIFGLDRAGVLARSLGNVACDRCGAWDSLARRVLRFPAGRAARESWRSSVPEALQETVARLPDAEALRLVFGSAPASMPLARAAVKLVACVLQPE
ncbi:unnamed protein product [Polarella glacialis]|uniref:Uncharacterized protein n=1 Tax=Polarella glacialis TaxID=89957 RepID=A0A813GY15_POLGL|nr:unnamed protein product [Polarella glacialis]